MRIFQRVSTAFLAVLLIAQFSFADNDGLTRPESVPKNIILVIGDGMGPQQLGLLELYAQLERKTETAFRRLASKATLALVQPIPANGLVVDSGCAATALASGVESLPRTLGLDARGKSVESILERAKAAGKSVGLVSDTRITHATPAAFVAHIIDRDNETEIAYQLANSSVDVLFSGGAKFFDIPLKGKTDSARSVALRNGFKIVTDAKELSEASAEPGKLLGLFAKSVMYDAFKEAKLGVASKELFREPTLVEMTEAALAKLSQNPKGFFLMVEAGQIDWAGHENDAGWLLHEMVRMDRVVDTVTRWQAANPTTLLLVTADHETGGFGFSYSSVDVPKPYSLPEQPVDAPKYAAKRNFVSRNVLKKLWQRSKRIERSLDGIVWATGNHTSTPVPLFAIGPANSRFGGLINQTEIGKILHSLVSEK